MGALAPIAKRNVFVYKVIMVTPNRPGRPQDATATAALLAAVVDLLAEEGVAGLTTAAVAARAGVSTATLYRRWPSKGALILAAASVLDDALPPPPDTGTTDGDLRALCDHKRAVLAGNVGGAVAALMAEAPRDAELREVLRLSVVAPVEAHLAEILHRAAARGERARVGAAEAADLILGLAFARICLRGAGDDVLSRRDEDVLVSTIIGGAA